MMKPAESLGEITDSALAIQSAEPGITKQYRPSAGSITESSRPTSRQIPTGKKLYVARREACDVASIESIVLKNDDVELAVKLAVPLEISTGEVCCVRSNFDASVWQFETSAVNCYGSILVLNHSADVRFTNRRRFLRVSANKAAFIARFPFARTLASNDDDDDAGEDLADSIAKAWGPPEFVPAVVTELGGPGLCIEAPLDVEVGDRVVVILRMTEEPTLNSVRDQRDISLRQAMEQKTKVTPLRIIEDIGEVRRTRAIQDGLSMAVELTGLSISNVNELTRETNVASLNTDIHTHIVSAEANRDYQIVRPRPAYSLCCEPVASVTL